MTGKGEKRAREERSGFPSDEALMGRVARGDRVAFDQLLRRYYRKVYATCFRLLNSKEEAEDAVQDVFLKVYRNAGSFKLHMRFSTWIYRVAVNDCLNRLRWKRRRRWFSLEGLVRQSNGSDEGTRLGDLVRQTQIGQPDEDLIRAERAEAVRRAIASLPEQQRVAVILHRYEGLSYREIAEIMGTTVSSVEARLHRAKIALSKKLAVLLEMGESEAGGTGQKEARLFTTRGGRKDLAR